MTTGHDHPDNVALHQYLATDLAAKLEQPYLVSGPELSQHWMGNRAEPHADPVFANTAPDLAWALSDNPELEVLVTSPGT